MPCRTSPTIRPSIPTRQALLGEADGLVSRLRSLDAAAGRHRNEVNERLELSVDDINRSPTAIADVNDKIALAGAGARPTTCSTSATGW